MYTLASKCVFGVSGGNGVGSKEPWFTHVGSEKSLHSHIIRLVNVFPSRDHIAKLPNPFHLKLLNSQVHPVDWFDIHCWISLSNGVVSMVLFTCKGYDLVAAFLYFVGTYCCDILKTSFLPTCVLSGCSSCSLLQCHLGSKPLPAKGRKVFRAERPRWRCYIKYRCFFCNAIYAFLTNHIVCKNHISTLIGLLGKIELGQTIQNM